jgi:ABC-2 type transport system ATP-binding protein
MTKTNFVIHTEGLTKDFGTVRALDGLDLTVRQGKSTASLAPTAPASPQQSGFCSD